MSPLSQQILNSLPCVGMASTSRLASACPKPWIKTHPFLGRLRNLKSTLPENRAEPRIPEQVSYCIWQRLLRAVWSSTTITKRGSELQHLVPTGQGACAGPACVEPQPVPCRDTGSSWLCSALSRKRLSHDCSATTLCADDGKPVKINHLNKLFCVCSKWFGNLWLRWPQKPPTEHGLHCFLFCSKCFWDAWSCLLVFAMLGIFWWGKEWWEEIRMWDRGNVIGTQGHVKQGKSRLVQKQHPRHWLNFNVEQAGAQSTGGIFRVRQWL